MTDPSANSPSGSTPAFNYPLRTKVIVVVVLAVAIGGFVLAGLTANTDNPDVVALSGEGSQIGNSGGSSGQSALGRGIESVRPRAGAESVLQQSEISIDLEPGWVAELVYAPEGDQSVVLPAAEVEVTPELDLFTYAPAPGKTIERLASNRSCVVATVWSRVEGRAGSERVVQWCFSVV